MEICRTSTAISRGFPDTGVDIDQSAIAIAQRRFATQGNFRFEAVPVEELAKRGERFDYVVIAGMLHHVDDQTAIEIIRSSWKSRLQAAY